MCEWLPAPSGVQPGRLTRAAASYMQQESWARLVNYISVAAFAVGEFSQAVKGRRGASGTDLLDEVVFRVIFFAGILMLPLAQVLAPDAVLNRAGVFVLGQSSDGSDRCCDGGHSPLWESTSRPW
jgi:hypothetical protein